MEPIKEQIKKFEENGLKNAQLIADFCEGAGMNVLEAGVAAECFSLCVKQALLEVGTVKHD